MPSSLGVDEDDLFNLAICPEGYKGNFKKNILDTTTFNPTSELNVIVIYIYIFFLIQNLLRSRQRGRFNALSTRGATWCGWGST